MRKLKVAFFVFLALCALAVAFYLLIPNDIAVLNPKGWIALRQRDLMITATWLMLIVVIPVFILIWLFAWKYRASNQKAHYTPDKEHNIIAETVWWGIPFAIIFILGIITWKGSRELDPFKPLETDKKLLTIQVVALQWKWLFIYPEYNIATVNFLHFPEKTPIRFILTADAPMNSFWIPQLGGQVFAMAGMETKLHLIANEVGSYRGSSANLSGRGFAGMWFMAHSTTDTAFEKWIQEVRLSSNVLNLDSYRELAKPTENHPKTTYVLQNPDLYDWIIMKYMMPMPDTEGKFK